MRKRSGRMSGPRDNDQDDNNVIGQRNSGGNIMRRSRGAFRPVAGAFLAGALVMPLAATAQDAECRIGFTVFNQQDVFFTRMVDGAREAAAELGCELSVANANNRAEQQTADVETLITQGVTGLIVDPVDPNGIQQVLADAREQGIFVVSVDTDVGRDYSDAFVGVDNGAAAEEFAHYMLEHGFEEGTRYGIIDARNSQIQNLREDRFRAIVDEAGAAFAQAVSGENQNEKAATAAESLLTSQPDLDYIYTTGTPATFGASSVLASRDADTPRVVGWDLSGPIIDGIDRGVVEAIVQQDSHGQGATGVRVLHDLLNGNEIEVINLIPITIVTRDNVDQFRDIYSGN